MEDYSLDEWNGNLCRYPCVMFTGSQTYSIRMLFRKFSDILDTKCDRKLILSENNYDMFKAMCGNNVVGNFNNGFIQRFLDGMLMVINRRRSADIRGLVILDNPPSDFYSSRPFIELLYNGRCYKTTVIVICDNNPPMTPELRSNFDYVCLMNMEENEINAYWNRWFGIFPSANLFARTYNQNANDITHGLFLVNRGARLSFREKIFKITYQ